MIDDPLNDTDCLGQLTEVAARATKTPEARALATRFATTAALAEHIRSLPQRDDAGDPADGPRVACDVSQRARLFPADPNCVERALWFLAVAELIDPAPTRQLATVDVSRSVRHTFPIESGEPVILDPEVRRNAVRAACWQLRNGSGAVDLGAAADLGPIIAWLLHVAATEAEDLGNARASTRVEHARRALRRLVRGGYVSAAERADVLYALALAGEVAEDFGPLAAEGYEQARAALARLLTRPTARRQALRIEPERALYFGGKAIATYYGVGGLYDVAYTEVRRATSSRRPPRRQPSRPSAGAVAASPRGQTPPAAPRTMGPDATTAPGLAPTDETTTAPPMVATAPANEPNDRKGELE